MLEFHAVRLCVTNFKKSVEFYRDILGFKGWHNKEQQYAYFEGINIALFSKEKMEHALFGDSQACEQKDPVKAIIQFESPDVDMLYKQLKDKGVHFINQPHDQKEWGSRVVHFYDPEGNIIELYHVL